MTKQILKSLADLNVALATDTAITEPMVTDTLSRERARKWTVTAYMTAPQIRKALKEADIEVKGKMEWIVLQQIAIENGLMDPGGYSRVPLSYKAKYGKEQNCGDEIAEAMLNVDCDLVAQQNDIDMERWAHLNKGMQRMNLGNVLRGRAQRGEPVRVNDRSWN